MIIYNKELKLNKNFNKSTNILYKQENCKNYVFTKATKQLLEILPYHNSISIIGPFGSGKSSLLLFIDNLINKNKNCLKKSKNYNSFFEDKKFLVIKIVAEHSSFRDKFKKVLLEYNLEKTSKYLKTDSFEISKVLEYIKEDIKNKYSDVLFLIDEFGKFIEHSDVFELQTLAEFINNQKNFKLIISLHKTFSEYKELKFNDFDKIQGRFEYVIIRDNYYENLNLLKEAIFHKSEVITKTYPLIDKIHKSCFNHLDKNIFYKISPIHPFSAIVISEIFSKYFQSQRTIYSFLFSNEENGFLEFINTPFEKNVLYSLSELYDYVSFLLRIYNVILPDKEIYFLSEMRLDDNKIRQNRIRIDLIKSISLILTFKLEKIVPLNKENIILSCLDRYEKNEIEKELEFLIQENILLFQPQNKIYSLIKDSNIDINKEIKDRQNYFKIDLEESLNKFFDKKILAKKFFIKYGNRKYFDYHFLVTPKEINKYTIIITNKEILQKDVISIVMDLNSFYEYLLNIEILEDIKVEFKNIISIETLNILENMIIDYKSSLEYLFFKQLKTAKINNKYKYSSKNIQNLMSDILEQNFNETPIINNYTFSHTLQNKATITTAIKKMYIAMMENSGLENLGIEKFPSHRALYISLIKNNIHQYQNNRWILTTPIKFNFQYVWKYINISILDKTNIKDLIDKLQIEPFGLSEYSALFFVTLFIVVNKDKISLFLENNYVFDINIDIIMNIFKNPKKYDIFKIELNKNQQNIFNQYAKLLKVENPELNQIILKIYQIFISLPKYSKYTQNLSKKSIQLRSILISMKDPIKGFFIEIPKLFENNFIEEFKISFNEIVLSYKELLSDLEKYFSNKFLFDSEYFPYNRGLIKIVKSFENQEIDKEIELIIKTFTYSNNFNDLIDNIAMILLNKKTIDFLDIDVKEFKQKIDKISQIILAKIDILSENKEIVKLSLITKTNNYQKVISIPKDNLTKIDKKLDTIDLKSFSKEEKLFLLSKLIQKELDNE